MFENDEEFFRVIRARKERRRRAIKRRCVSHFKPGCFITAGDIKEGEKRMSRVSSEDVKRKVRKTYAEIAREENTGC